MSDVTWKNFPIKIRKDGSYVIQYKGHPYHVPNKHGWAAGGHEAVLWPDVKAFADANKSMVSKDEMEDYVEIERKREATDIDSVAGEMYFRFISSLHGTPIRKYDDRASILVASQSNIPYMKADGLYALQQYDALWKAIDESDLVAKYMKNDKNHIKDMDDLANYIIPLAWPTDAELMKMFNLSW